MGAGFGVNDQEIGGGLGGEGRQSSIDKGCGVLKGLTRKLW